MVPRGVASNGQLIRLQLRAVSYCRAMQRLYVPLYRVRPYLLSTLRILRSISTIVHDHVESCYPYQQLNGRNRVTSANTEHAINGTTISNSDELATARRTTVSRPSL